MRYRLGNYIKTLFLDKNTAGCLCRCLVRVLFVDSNNIQPDEWELTGVVRWGSAGDVYRTIWYHSLGGERDK